MTLEARWDDWRREVEGIDPHGDEARAAERVDAALSAARAGAGDAAVRSAFGADAAGLAALARRLAPPAAWTASAPDPAFAHALEARLVAAFDVQAAADGGGRGARRSELWLVAGAAAVLALAAFILRPHRGIAPPLPPTLEAATRTATLAISATPAVAVTPAPSSTGDRFSLAPRPGAPTGLGLAAPRAHAPHPMAARMTRESPTPRPARPASAAPDTDRRRPTPPAAIWPVGPDRHARA